MCMCGIRVSLPRPVSSICCLRPPVAVARNRTSGGEANPKKLFHDLFCYLSIGAFAKRSQIRTWIIFFPSLPFPPSLSLFGWKHRLATCPSVSLLPSPPPPNTSPYVPFFSILIFNSFSSVPLPYFWSAFSDVFFSLLFCYFWILLSSTLSSVMHDAMRCNAIKTADAISGSSIFFFLRFTRSLQKNLFHNLPLCPRRTHFDAHVSHAQANEIRSWERRRGGSEGISSIPNHFTFFQFI